MMSKTTRPLVVVTVTAVVAALLAAAVAAQPAHGTPACPGATSVDNKANFHTDTIYQVLTDRFYDGDPSNNNPHSLANTYDPDGTDINRYFGGDWEGLAAKAEYLENLGVTAVWISPPYENLNEPYLENSTWYNAYHGFWAKDYFRPDPHWGDWNPFDDMVDELNSRGIKVVIDFAPNHTNHRDSAELGGFYRDGVFMGDADNDTEGYFHHHGNRQSHQTSRFDYQWRDLANLSDLSQENSDVVEYLEDAIDIWLDRGIAGIRNDATLHQNDAFLKTWADHINQNTPVFHFGEYWVSTPDPKYDEYRTFQDRTGISILDFEYANVARSVFGDHSKNMNDFAAMLNYTEGDYTYETNVVTFIDNHDKSRIASLQGNQGIIHTALAVLLTSRGVPAIYYGTEHYMEGANGDDGRKAMLGYDNERTMANIGWDEDTDAFELIAALASLRKANPALGYGTTTVRWHNADVLVFERKFFDNVVLVAVNRHGGTGHNITGLVTSLPNGTHDDVLDGQFDGQSISVSSGAVSNFTLKPTEIAVWEHRATPSGPQIGAVGPTIGPPGQIVTIDGEGFGGTAGTVTFDTEEADIVCWSSDQIKVEVPSMNAGIVDIQVEASSTSSNTYRYEVLGGDQVQVIFKVEATTTMGEMIYVVGDIHELGEWDPDNAVIAFHNPAYPEWFLPVSVPADTTFEFKFIKKDGATVSWEPGSNRQFTSPAGGVADTALYDWGS